MVVYVCLLLCIITIPTAGNSIHLLNAHDTPTWLYIKNSMTHTVYQLFEWSYGWIVAAAIQSLILMGLKKKYSYGWRIIGSVFIAIISDITIIRKGCFYHIMMPTLRYQSYYPFVMTAAIGLMILLIIFVYEIRRVGGVYKMIKPIFKKGIKKPGHFLNQMEKILSNPDDIQPATASLKEVKEKKKKKSQITSPIALPSFSFEGSQFMVPPIDLLDEFKRVNHQTNESALQESSRLLHTVLEEFGVKGDISHIRPGPVVTLYEFKPAPGIKTARVISLGDDIARSMSALSARIATVAGQNVIGIELPNKVRQTVYMKELLMSKEYLESKVSLPLILGKDIGGHAIIADLAKMPHLLVAGTTGSGKSVAVNVMILSLLFRLPPHMCKFIMIDPKMLELSVYDDIPHLLTPVVTDPKKAVVALKWAVKEMENRYRAMAKLGVRNIEGYNQRLQEAQKNGELLSKKIQTGYDPDTGLPIFENQPLDMEPFPFIVVIVDEMADLMLVAGKDIEAAVQRLAQMARAAGIHLIMATQRPSVDVITGTIKANFPTRMSFQVTSKIDSRTILGEQGAEQLLGQGDMLYMVGGGRITRVHGPFVKDTEVERIVNYLKAQGEPNYIETVTQDDGDDLVTGASLGGGDDLYKRAVEVMLREGKISTSFIQRQLQIGYNRAATLIEQMEKNGLISPANHAGKREILTK
jgi:S-DNA-T family DNA segregation ATPase FtsK/SpoIIIE